MDPSSHLSDLHIEVARIFFALDSSKSYLVAGGAALLAVELIARPTEDLDLFASAPVSTVTEAHGQFVDALRSHGYDVATLQEGPTFCRLVVGATAEDLLVDLAIDSPPTTRPTMTVLGPTVSPAELAGRKMLALFGRAEARDFADVYVLAQHFGKETLIKGAARLDAGFDITVLAQMMGSLGRFTDDEVPLSSVDLTLARDFFHTWATDLRQ